MKPTTALEAFDRPTHNVGHPIHLCRAFAHLFLFLIPLIHHFPLALSSFPTFSSALSVFPAVPRLGRGVNCLGASQSSSWRSRRVAALPYLFVLYHLTTLSHRRRPHVQLLHHTLCTYMRQFSVPESTSFNKILFPQTCLFALLHFFFISLLSLFLLSTFPPSSIARANKAIKA